MALEAADVGGGGPAPAAPKGGGGGGFGGFIKAVRKGAGRVAGAAETGTEAMANKIGNAFASDVAATYKTRPGFGLMPSGRDIVQSAKQAILQPTLPHVGNALLNATAYLGLGTEGGGAELAKLGSRAGGLSSEVGAARVGGAGKKLYSAAEIAMRGSGQVEQKLRAASEAADVAKPIAAHAVDAITEGAAHTPAAEVEQGGRGLLAAAKEKALAYGKDIYGSPKKVAEDVAMAGKHAVEAVIHPGIRQTPVSLAKAAGRGVGAVMEARGLMATAAGAAGVYAAETRPGAAKATGIGTSSFPNTTGKASSAPSDAELAKNMHMSQADFEGIKAVNEKYGAAGLKALTSGLAKARKAGYDVAAGAGQSNVVSPLLPKLKRTQKAAQQAAQGLLRASVASSYRPGK